MTLLVTGGANGIGAAIVEQARDRGEHVISLDLESGVDAADPAAVRAFLDSGPVPTRVAHIAGVVGKGGIDEIGLDEWDRVIRANLTSAFVVMSEVVPRMADAGGGAVVLMSSLNARDGGTTMSGAAYASAKAGVLGLMRHIAVQWGTRNVRANGIAPGPVRTRIHDRLDDAQRAGILAKMPLPRVAEPQEIAEMVLFLLSDACASVTGTTFDVNGGSHLN
ncbi:SDR family NAD(P)-dependent oxidoreductase [Microbacterium sp. SLBN-146]|uniref:SDR family NAD(P)-dependent oxidoreductase n=1 Tax=Microbacterium sp. SLBN-146 TaxID=2768457 RepID=UPI00116DEC35|nr:SDR family oxidoreductase [Microbacterium sp. SLBN-146]TQJ30741.1 2-hydroxycyclohexanecarboxyl-CoA dehydrogenase [Microbacterium sp. SLBN-146]